MGDAFKGLPQGLNTSPILSILTLEDWVQSYRAKGVKLLMYADDGIIYSDKPFEVYPPEGIEFNDSKSR